MFLKVKKEISVLNDAYVILLKCINVHKKKLEKKLSQTKIPTENKGTISHNPSL